MKSGNTIAAQLKLNDIRNAQLNEIQGGRGESLR